MAEKQKRSVTPGLIKVPEYQKPEIYTINPTLQIVEDELPVAQKSVIFTEQLAQTISFANWIPPEGKLDLTEEMITPNINVEIKPVQIKHIPIPVQKCEPLQETTVQTPASDIEIILNQTAMINEIKAEVKPTIKETYIPKVQPEETKANKVNNFKIVNETVTTTQTETPKTISDITSIIKIGKTHLQVGKDTKKKNVYMLDNEKCSREKAAEFAQSISGKVLAMDCKVIEVYGTTYKLQNNVYKDANNNTFSIDEMLEKIHI